MESNVDFLIDKYKENETVTRFAKEFGEFCGRVKNDVIVETGLGISTLYILKNIPKTSFLYSCDPNPWFPDWNEIHLINFYHIPQESRYGLIDWYISKNQKIDIFLHDGLHEYDTMKMEYDWAFDHVRSGGYIFSDDADFGGSTAWQEFIAKYSLTSHKLGSLEYVQKP